LVGVDPAGPVEVAEPDDLRRDHLHRERLVAAGVAAADHRGMQAFVEGPLGRALVGGGHEQ